EGGEPAVGIGGRGAHCLARGVRGVRVRAAEDVEEMMEVEPELIRVELKGGGCGRCRQRQCNNPHRHDPYWTLRQIRRLVTGIVQSKRPCRIDGKSWQRVSWVSPLVAVPGRRRGPATQRYQQADGPAKPAAWPWRLMDAIWSSDAATDSLRRQSSAPTAHLTPTERIASKWGPSVSTRHRRPTSRAS